MKRYERILLSKLLKKASEEFSKHGCNDFFVSDHICIDDVYKLGEDITKWNKEKVESLDHDWLLMAYFADKIMEE